MVIFYSCVPTKKILCIGDSLTCGFLVGGNTYPFFLSKKLRQPIRTIGEIGEKSITLLAKVPSVLAENPTHVLLEIGANDYFLHNSAEEFQEHLYKIVSELQTKKVKVALIQFFNDDILLRTDESNKQLLTEYKEIYKKCSEEFYIPLVADIWGDIFFVEKFKSDEFHPNSFGNEIMAENILNTLSKSFFD